MKLTRLAIATILLLTTIALLQGDMIHLKDGRKFEGTFIGGNTREVQFMGPRGPLNVPITSVAAIEFKTVAPPPPPPAPPPPPPKRSAPPPPAAVTIPAGTPITVRMIDGIDSKTTGPGERFRCSIDDPIIMGSSTVVPRGADCTVQIIEAEANKELAIKLYDITVNGKAFDAVSNYANVEATGTSKKKKGLRRGVGLGAMGAGIGAIAGGGKGAAIGAVAGASVGAISAAASKGKTLNVPPETRLAFQLRAPLPLG